MAIDKETRDRWINAIVDLASETSKRNNLFEKYTIKGTILITYVPFYQGITNIDIIRRNIEELIKQSDNKQTDAGAIVLRLLKTDNKLKGTPKYKHQHKMIDLLSRQQLQLPNNSYIHLLNLLSAKDKLTVLNLLEFKYNTEEYKRVYQKLGKFKLGENKENLEAEKKAVVHAFHNLLNSLKRSKDKKTNTIKLTAAQTFLETLAENKDYLQAATYEEKTKKITDKNKKKKEATGKILTISSSDKAEMLKFMQDSAIDFSTKCLNFFAEKPSSVNTNSYLKTLLNKLSTFSEITAQQKISAKNFTPINTSLQQQELVFDDTVKLYATYLFNHAGLMNTDENISPDILKSLIDKNIQSRNAKLKAESIFPDTEPEIKDNKDLVLQVAEIYAQSFISSAPEAEEFNPEFHKKMTDMFKQITQEQNYNHKDIQKLCNTLKKNSDIEMQRMANNIASSSGFSGNSNHGYSF